MSEIKNKLESLKNPYSGKTFGDENRIKEVVAEGAEVKLKYSRDGLSLEEKRAVEDLFYEQLSSDFDEDGITILSVSTESAPMNQTNSSPQKPDQGAQLKAGHGPAGANKKRVPNVKKVIAVSSCKGGVGKSTVAVNLCLALKKEGLRVGLIDADIYGPSVPMLLGQREAQPKANQDKKIVPVEAFGIKFISFGLFIKEGDPVIWRGPMLGGVLNQFLFDVDWGELDLLIIDLPPGTGDMQLSMIQTTEVDGVVTVTTPQSVALLDSKKGVAMFRQVNIPILGLVENMSYFVPDDAQDKKYFIFGQDGARQAAEELKIPFLGEIPLEIPLREGSDNGVPYMSVIKYQGRPVWEAFSQLASQLIQGLEVKAEKKGILSRFF